MNSVSIVNKPVYYYRIGNQNQSVSDKNVLKNIGMSEKILDDSLKYYYEVRTQLDSIKNEYFLWQLMIAFRGVYNAFLRNYWDKNNYKSLLIYDNKLKEKNWEIYNRVLRKYAYIRLAKRNLLGFIMSGIALRLYKKITGRHS